MDFIGMSDKAVIAELGKRIRRQRLNQNVTQKELAEKAGVAYAVVQKLEQGEDCRIGGLIRILRALGGLDQLDLFLPDPGVSPLQLVRQQSHERQRAAKSRNSRKESK